MLPEPHEAPPPARGQGYFFHPETYPPLPLPKSTWHTCLPIFEGFSALGPLARSGSKSATGLGAQTKCPLSGNNLFTLKGPAWLRTSNARTPSWIVLLVGRGTQTLWLTDCKNFLPNRAASAISANLPSWASHCSRCSANASGVVWGVPCLLVSFFFFWPLARSVAVVVTAFCFGPTRGPILAVWLVFRSLRGV